MELLEYQLSKGVRAFSTLRTSEELGKGAYASFMASPYLGFISHLIVEMRQNTWRNVASYWQKNWVFPKIESYYPLKHIPTTSPL